MDKRIQIYVSSLTTEEIEAQLNDIFSWAKEYQSVLTQELLKRNSKSSMVLDGRSNYGLIEAESDSEQEDFVKGGISLDYRIVSTLQEQTNALSLEDAISVVERLKKVSTRGFSELEVARLSLQLDMCEARICELRGTGLKTSDPFNCLVCGSTLAPDDVFCGKCGHKA